MDEFTCYELAVEAALIALAEFVKDELSVLIAQLGLRAYLHSHSSAEFVAMEV